MMKKLYTLLIALLIVGGAMGQTDDPCETCLPDGITFTTQAQIDSFQVNYPGCTEIEGNVEILGNDITNLLGLTGLTSLGGNITIRCDSLPSLNGLHNITLIDSSLIIGSPFELASEKNKSLIDLQGLQGLTTIGGHLIICKNDTLLSLQGLDNLNKVSGGVIIHSNNELLTCYGLNNLDTVEGNFELGIIGECGMGSCPYGNNKLENINDLQSLVYVGGGLHLLGNAILGSLSGLNNFSFIGGDLRFAGNDSLISLSGLENIIAIGGSIRTGGGDIYGEYGNVSLISLSGLDNLISIGGDLNLWNNYVLSDLSALSNLISIGGMLSISHNDQLTDLNGLHNINPVSINGLDIQQNASLMQCEVLSICNYLLAPNGSIQIVWNAIGCNSPEEVQDSCIANAVDIPDQFISEKLSIYPNPAHSAITIELSIQPSKITTLTLSSTSGQQLITQPITKPQTEIDISHLPVGIYIVKVWNDKDVMVQKVIKQ